MRSITITRALAAAAAIGFAAGSAAQDKVTISISTGPTSGVYYPIGGGIANVLTKYVPGYAANAEATDGSIANLQLMSQKKSDIALSMADAGWDGLQGQGKFQDGAVAVRALMVPTRTACTSSRSTGPASARSPI